MELDEDEEKPSPIKQDMSKGTYSYDGKTALYTDPKDATVYFWDVDKNAWFPKVDDDFLANYQMNYGFVDNSEKTEDKVPEKPKTPPEVGRKRAANPPSKIFIHFFFNLTNRTLKTDRSRFYKLKQKKETLAKFLSLSLNRSQRFPNFFTREDLFKINLYEP